VEDWSSRLGVGCLLVSPTSSGRVELIRGRRCQVCECGTSGESGTIQLDG
jgi:hypothetical protein